MGKLLIHFIFIFFFSTNLYAGSLRGVDSTSSRTPASTSDSPSNSKQAFYQSCKQSGGNITVAKGGGSAEERDYICTCPGEGIAYSSAQGGTPQCASGAKSICDHSAGEFCDLAPSDAKAACMDQWQKTCGQSNSSLSTSNGNATYPATDQAALTDAIQSCGTQQSLLQSACNPDQNSTVSDIRSTVQAAAAGASALAGMQDACSSMQRLSQALNGLMGAYSGGCTPVISSCQNACQTALSLANKKNTWTDSSGQHTSLSSDEDPSALKDRVAQCGQWQQPMQQVQQDVQAYQAAALQGTICAQRSASSDFCKSNPSSNICKSMSSDCSDPVNANTVTCICQKNPGDPLCGRSANSNISTSTASNSGGDAASDPGGLTASDLAALNSQYGEAPTFDPVTGKPTGVSGVAPGGGRGMPQGSASGNAAYGSASGGGVKSGGSGYNTNVYGGLSGGGGGRYGIPTSNAGGSSGSYGNYYGAPAGNNMRSAGIDLKDFLPGGRRDPNRGLAGQGGPDGITDANGMTLWQKASRRYNIIRPQMKD